jgi:hypothetical protein
MNRHNRRKFKKSRVGDLVLIDYGQLLPRNQNHRQPINCYVCGATHQALGFARIEFRQSTTAVPLCSPCLASGERSDAVVRKFLNAPELRIDEGGEATTEQVMAVAEKQDTTEH